MTRLASPPRDAVSDVLRTFGVRSTIFCVSELRAPWAFSVTDEPVAKFHIVLSGCALLETGGSSTSLAEGDTVVLPRGIRHALSDESASTGTPLEQLIDDYGLDDGLRLRYGGSGPLTRLLCGGFVLNEGIPDSTLRLLPDVLQLPFDAAPWLGSLLADLNQEAASDRPGASAIVTKIADVFLAQALRVWLLDAQWDHFADPQRMLEGPVAKAVSALETRPSEPWSLDALARHVGLSRSALATKFREGIGESPIRYLSGVRLRRAARELADGRLTLHEVGRRAGYATDAAFAKAFKRHFGTPPGAYRGRAGDPPRVDFSSVASEGVEHAHHDG
jgi:AraC-like DNA-binding protein